jgi:hypothetical protein
VCGGARADGFIESLAAAGFVQTTAQEIEYKRNSKRRDAESAEKLQMS